MQKKSDHLISIITVVYNAVTTIEKTIQSVLNQSYSSYEYIIIDGGSQDGTLEILKKYADKIKWISESDKGIYDAMNKGIKIATGNFIYFLGSDDLFYSANSLKKVSEYLVSSYEIYYGDVQMIPSNKRYCGKVSKGSIIRKNICHQSIFYPAILLKNTLFNERYPIYADYAINLYFYSNKGIIFKYIPLIIAYFNTEGASSLIKDPNFENDFYTIIYQKFGFFSLIKAFLYKEIYKILKNGKIRVCRASK